MPVYFIRAGEDGPVKIGWSRSPAYRVAYLQRKHSDPLMIIRQIESRHLINDATMEHWLHARFDHLLIGAEWFHFTPLMLTIEVPELLPFNADFVRRAKIKALVASRQDAQGRLGTRYVYESQPRYRALAMNSEAA